ncbi:MAG: metallophosphoesterase [Firmicutes bacterium]|nr:metallophosphoesterase [Bacillota bacterium]
MSKLLIFSDTHGETAPCVDIILSSRGIDGIIHAGDCVRDAEDLEAAFPSIPIYYVRGNNDFFTRAPMSLNLEIGGARVYVTHGHMQNVKHELTLRTLKNEARGAALVVFGHTHQPITEYDGEMTILNPGSTLFSRTYAEAEITNGKVKTRILTL